MFFLWESHLTVKLWRSIWEILESKIANSDDIIFTYFVITGHVIRIYRFFACVSLLHSLSHSHTKHALVVTAEIFPFLNCCVGNFVKCIMLTWTATWQNQQSDYAPSEDSDQPGHPPSLIRVFAVRMKKPWVHSYPLSAQRKLWSDWADAIPDLSLCWAHTQFVGFVMSRLSL